MIEQLKEMLEMQDLLDHAIMVKKGITKYPSTNMRIAMFVELGEMMNEFSTHFKHWKSTAVDNREKGLVEFVDALHFALSLANYEGINLNEKHIQDYLEYDRLGQHFEIDKRELMWLLPDAVRCRGAQRMNYLLMIGKYFGFTWDEIYQAYIGKNKVNYERLKNNY